MDRRKILLVVAIVVAALGAGLVFYYAQGAEDRAKDKIQTVSVLVAQQTIPPGESASDAANKGKLISVRVPADQVLEGSTNEGTDFTDSVALTTIYPGEQLLKQKFGTLEEIEGKATLPLPEGKTAITLQLTDAGRVSSFTQPGSHVAVYYTPVVEADAGLDNNTVAVAPACVIESDVLVLGVGSRSVDQESTGNGDTGNGDETDPDTVPVTFLTIAVDSSQASKLIGFQTSAAAAGKDGQLLTFALRNDESEVRNTQACVDIVKSVEKGFGLSGQGGQGGDGGSSDDVEG